MGVTGGYRALHTDISADARDTWQAIADAHGTSVTALVEAYAAGLQPCTPTTRQAELVRQARTIDSVNRRRHGQR